MDSNFGASINRLNCLKSLTIYDASLTFKNFESIATIKTLTELKIKMCFDPTDELFELLSSLSLLTSFIFIAFDGSSLTDEGLKHLGNLKNLTNLDFYFDNETSGEEFVSFIDNFALTELRLEGFKKLSGIGLGTVGMIKTLEKLKLHDCDTITEATLKDFAQNSAITTLSILHCDYFTDSAVECISKIQTLKKVECIGAPEVTPDGLVEHLRGHPNIYEINLRLGRFDKRISEARYDGYATILGAHVKLIIC